MYATMCLAVLHFLRRCDAACSATGTVHLDINLLVKIGRVLELVRHLPATVAIVNDTSLL